MESQEVEEKIKTLAKWVGESQNIVFFGGAGVSTESGIPDFRSIDGLYHQKYDFRRKRFEPLRFLKRIPTNSIASIMIRCSALMPNQTQPTRN